ncbi:hypothetical protein T10_6259 [Trichinella papuae]|uniref:Uncharacterized protein n=1 Tax=Trichinella papuae TaxID=268474 RepID=A0A0V1ME75_9BILA|nr:hypothetical protein T10_6259 [Trichinella papuae]
MGGLQMLRVEFGSIFPQFFSNKWPKSFTVALTNKQAPLHNPVAIIAIDAQLSRAKAADCFCRFDE